MTLVWKPRIRRLYHSFSPPANSIRTSLVAKIPVQQYCIPLQFVSSVPTQRRLLHFEGLVRRCGFWIMALRNKVKGLFLSTNSMEMSKK